MRIAITLFLLVAQTINCQYTGNILNIDAIPAHKLFTQNIEFSEPFTQTPQVALSILHADTDQLEFYCRADQINTKGFVLQVISTSIIKNLKINYMAINDEDVQVTCQNYKNNKEEIQVQKNSAIFLTGISGQQIGDLTILQQKDNAILKTNLKQFGACFIFGNIQEITSIIKTNYQNHQFNVDIPDISNFIKLPLQLISFDDIINKIAINNEEQFQNIDSISILNTNQDEQQQQNQQVDLDDSTIIQSVEITFNNQIQSDQQYFTKIQQNIANNVQSEQQQDLIQSKKKTLAQVEDHNQIDDLEYLPLNTIDMDDLYKEYTLQDQNNQQNLQQERSVIISTQEQSKDTNELINKENIEDNINQNEQKEINHLDNNDEQKSILDNKQLIDVPLFDEGLNFDDLENELNNNNNNNNNNNDNDNDNQSNDATQYIIDVYQNFVDEENEKLKEEYEQQHPYIEIDQTNNNSYQDSEEEEDDELQYVQHSLDGIDKEIDISLFYDDNNNIEEKNDKQNNIFQEATQFKKPQQSIDNVMEDLMLPQKLYDSEDEIELISQLKQKSQELRQKLKEQYDQIPKLDDQPNQQIIQHNIDDQYPKSDTIIDPAIEYQIESKYVDWTMNQNNKIEQITTDLENDGYLDPRFSLLEIQQNRELEIEKQIQEFLGFDDEDIMFVMVKQNLRQK